MVKLTTDPRWAINEDDVFTISTTTDVSPNMAFWKMKVGDRYSWYDGNAERRFSGRVLGTAKGGQPGRTLLVQTGPRHYVYLDALTSVLKKDRLYRNGRLVPTPKRSRP